MGGLSRRRPLFIRGGVYFHPRGGKPGVRSPKDGVEIDHKEFPKEWFEGLKPDNYRARRYDKKANKYGVVAGQDQAFWEEHGWIIDQDPRRGSRAATTKKKIYVRATTNEG